MNPFGHFFTTRSIQFCLAMFFICALPGAGRTQTVTNFRIANGTSGENPALLWVGVDQGFYRKHGLNVEVIFMLGGGGWANNMLALDHLGLDPDRDNIRFIVLGDQPSRIQALETGRAHASWMGSTFSAPLKKKGYTVLLELGRAPISYLGASLVARKSSVRQDPKLYESVLKGTIDAMRFFMKPENKPAVLQSIVRVLRLPRLEDAENGYNAMLSVYSSDMKPKAEGVKKIYSILARTNPKLQSFKPESIIDDALIQKIQASGY
jgi:ABC-type nitrate/sulfonate/bicarbonate transport system substrate-binding protein